MTTPRTQHTESLTYWIRLEDMLQEPRIGRRLIEHAHRGRLLMQSHGDPVAWIQQAEALVQLVETQIRQAGGTDYPDLVDLARSTPAVDSLQSLLAAMHTRAGGSLSEAAS